MARFRNATAGRGGRRKFGRRFHESQMRDEMILNSRTFARTDELRKAVRRAGSAKRERNAGDIISRKSPLMVLSAFTAAVLSLNVH